LLSSPADIINIPQQYLLVNYLNENMGVINKFRLSAVLLCAAFLLFASSAFGKTLLLNSSFSLGDLGVNQATGITYDSTDDKLWLCDSGGADRIAEVPLTGGSIDREYSYASLGFRAAEGITHYDSGTLVLVDMIEDKIFGVDTSDGSLTGTIDLFAKGVNGPASIALDATDNSRWVGAWESHRLFHLDSSNVVIGSLYTGTTALEGTAFDSTNLKLFNIERADAILHRANRDGSGSSQIDLGNRGINEPTGVSWRASDGHLFISDLSATPKIFELDTSYNVVNSFTLHANNIHPTDVAYHPTNQQLYVTDNATIDHIFVYQTNGTYVEDFSLGKGNAEGICVIENDNLYVMDFGGTIVELTTGWGFVGEHEIGQSLPTNGAGLAFDGAHYYIPDYAQQKIYLVSTAGNIDGSFDTSSFGGNQPEGICYDSASGHLFIADSNSDRLYETTTAGVLQESWDLSAFGINYPTGVTMESNEEDIYISDIEDDRVYYLSITEGVGMMGDLDGDGEGFDGGTLFGFNTEGSGTSEVVDLEGDNVAEMTEGSSVSMYTWISVPVYDAKLSFEYMMGEFDETDYFAVLFEGEAISTLDINDKTDCFQTVEVDISQFGGQTGELAFFLAGQSDDLNPDRIWLDNIAVTGIPEPPSWTLFCMGSALLCATVRLRRRENRRGSEVKG